MVVQVSAGWNHALFLVKVESDLASTRAGGSGRTVVYSSGSNENFQCGGSDEGMEYSTPTLVPFFSSTSSSGSHGRELGGGGGVVQVAAAGGYSSYVLTEGGALFSFGCNEDGELGIGTKSEGEATPQRVLFPTPPGGGVSEEEEESVKIASIAAGSRFAVALSQCGTVYSFGITSNGRLGRVGGDQTRPGIVEMPFEGGRWKPVVEVVCGDATTLCVVSPTEVYGFGYNGYGNLGLGHTEDQPTPVRLTFFEDHPQSKLRMGADHVVGMLEGGVRLVVFGHNEFYQLMLGDMKTKTTPVIIEESPLKKSRTTPVIIEESPLKKRKLSVEGAQDEGEEVGDPVVADIVLGCSHTLLVTTDGRLYFVGYARALGRDGPPISDLVLVSEEVAFAVDTNNFSQRCLTRYAEGEQTLLDVLSTSDSHLVFLRRGESHSDWCGTHRQGGGGVGCSSSINSSSHSRCCRTDRSLLEARAMYT